MNVGLDVGDGMILIYVGNDDIDGDSVAYSVGYTVGSIVGSFDITGINIVGDIVFILFV